MAQDRPDHMKAINTSLTPPEEDLKGPDEDVPQVPLPQVVPVKALDENPSDGANEGRDRSTNPDNAPGRAARNPDGRTNRRDA
jgi:hypothetical protein